MLSSWLLCVTVFGSRAVKFVSIATVGLVEAPQIRIWPMTWDDDCDSVLAIVGTAYLIVAPMVI